MGPVSGLLWLSAAAVAIVCRFIPGAPDDHDALFWGLTAFTVVYSIACITRVIRWERVGLGGHALAILALQPLIDAALWLTGGADAYLGPMLVLPMLYVAYFFPARFAWPLAACEILTYASPLVTSSGPTHLLVHRALSYAVAYVGLVATIQFLKGRLVNAERHQHRMARIDPLTGLQNRRAFDEALCCAFESAQVFTLLLADVDSFKQINDRFGHVTGDRVLREFAAHATAAVRSGDCLARIGGDEFALVAPGAGEAGAERIAVQLRAAIIRAGARATVGRAIYPDDGYDHDTLLRAADRRLYAGKPAARSRFITA
jgi:diguanylate cyclase (GGDEF)-like protein